MSLQLWAAGATGKSGRVGASITENKDDLVTEWGDDAKRIKTLKFSHEAE